MISELMKNGMLPKIKNLIFNEIQKYQSDVELNESFFQIESSELDPLEINKPYFIIKYKEE